MSESKEVIIKNISTSTSGGSTCVYGLGDDNKVYYWSARLKKLILEGEFTV